MKLSHLCFGSLVVLSAFYGCKTDPSSSGENEAGQTGDNPDGGTSAEGGTGNQSHPSDGGAGGEAGADVGGSPGGNTGGAFDRGGEGGDAETGGTLGDAGNPGLGEGGGAGEAGGGGTGTDTGPDGLIVTQLAAGYGFTCALTTAGGVKCWGENSYGTLGNGQLSGRTATATDVVGLTSGVKGLWAGNWHVCALKTDNHLVCWGTNEYDQLAIDSTLAGSGTPVSLAGFADFAKSAGFGERHSCLVDDLGAIQCWGSNAQGQLGVDSPTSSSNPVKTAGLAFGFKEVTAGTDHSCGLTTEGTVQCWGSNYYGQLGVLSPYEDAEGISSSVDPVDVEGLTDVAKLSGSGRQYTCVLTTAGGVKCWGVRNYGYLGGGEDHDVSSAPADVTGLVAGVKDVASGYMHSCAVLAAGGTVMCWGYNQNGQLGNNPSHIEINESSLVPVAVVGLSGATTVTVGNSHSCAAMARGGVKCWGSGWASGSTMSTNQLLPLAIAGF